MNTKVLLLGAVVTVCTFTTFATDAWRSPRAAGNQLEIVRSTAPATATRIAYVNDKASLLTPRAQASQNQQLQGATGSVAATQTCRQAMVASPKAVAECAAHTTMPACLKLASAK
jgi:hypothetical protein